MSFDQDPYEQANISSADLAIMIDEMKRLQQQNTALKCWDDVFGHLGTPGKVAEEWNRLSDENASLRNRLEAATNGTQAKCARAAIAAGDNLIHQRDKLLQAMRNIEHAVAPTHEDGAYHENAYSLATAAIAEAESQS